MNTLHGNGLFSTLNAAFASFLSEYGQMNDPDDFRFVCRNFLLDERVTPGRASAYAFVGAAANHAEPELWTEAHHDYLMRFVNTRAGAGLRSGSASLPVTFHDESAFIEFGASEESLELIRVEDLQSIVRRVRRHAGEADEVYGMAKRVSADKFDAEAVAFMTDLFHLWNQRRDHRPIFASFFDGVHDLFGTDPATDARDWEHQLRARLGLSHFDIIREPIPILVLKYAVRLIKPLSLGRGAPRPLVAPTVLDGGFLSAFCPAPKESRMGSAVHLHGDVEQLTPEVVHPYLEFRPEMIFRVGRMTDRITVPLHEARGAHILLVRERGSRDDYATGTDQDIA